MHASKFPIANNLSCHFNIHNSDIKKSEVARNDYATQEVKCHSSPVPCKHNISTIHCYTFKLWCVRICHLQITEPALRYLTGFRVNEWLQDLCHNRELSLLIFRVFDIGKHGLWPLVRRKSATAIHLFCEGKHILVDLQLELRH